VIKLNVESLSFQGCRDPAVIYRNGHKWFPARFHFHWFLVKAKKSSKSF
jgi:hypothetical protein